MIRRFARVAAACLCLLPASSARAAYDMSGKWLLRPVGWHMDITQAGGSVADSFTYMSGPFDETTGHFLMGLMLPPNSESMEGDVSADGMTFSANLTGTYCSGPTPHTITCNTTTEPVEGTRCGNGVLDAGEECDDGNGDDGDCCSSACTIEAEGSTCTADDDPCTIDTCDAAATCTHTFSSGPCSEPHGCGTGDCSTGSCVVTSPTAAGTSCDLDSSVCTPDACDGAGVCAAAAPIDCTACAYCSPTQGCIAPEFDFYYQCQQGPQRASVTLKLADDAKKDHLTLKYSMPLDMPYVGDPTAGAGYTACVYWKDGDYERPLATMTIPGATTCGNAPCWTATDAGYAYKDRDAAADGVSSFLIDADKGLQIKAKGAGIGLPATLPPGAELSEKIIAGTGMTDWCWYQSLSTDRESDTQYKGSFIYR